MAVYTIKRNKYPVLDMCGWCQNPRVIVARVKFQLDFDAAPGGVTVDLCAECLKTQEGEFDQMGLLRQ